VNPDLSNQTPQIPKLPTEVLNSLPEAIRLYVQYLEARVHELEVRLAKNSSNSSKPPGSDGFKKKTKSMRGKSGKKPGAQPGHAGKRLAQVEKPNFTVDHAPTTCKGCGENLNEVAGSCAEKRQVFDVPKPQVIVTEHRAIEKQCPCCGDRSRGIFPENVRGPVQYGEWTQALISYLHNNHLIPVDRVCEIVQDLFGMNISPGTCCATDERLCRQLEPFEQSLRAHLLASKILHFDETGMRCEKKLFWVHVASSQLATLYTIHPKRGQEAMHDGGILPKFQGTGVHDHWSPYFIYEQITHVLCNAHHLRELTFIHEEEKEDWAGKMKDLLLYAKKEVENHFDKAILPEGILKAIDERYSQILVDGYVYHLSLPPLPTGKRGRQKQREGKNLLDRLLIQSKCVLRFMHDFSIPFTNNRGEQDIRMIKLKQKISGCFRTETGGKVFCLIRSYISTARKQGWRIWDALAAAIKGTPYVLDVEHLSTATLAAA
jgi:transposase